MKDPQALTAKAATAYPEIVILPSLV